jgi:hypothetical protein
MDLKNGVVRLPQDVAHLHGYGSMGLGAAADDTYIDVTDGGGWTFRAYADGRLKIVAGPSGVGTIYTPGDAAYETVLSRLRARDPRIDTVLQGSVPPGSSQASGFVSNFLSKLGVGAGGPEAGPTTPEQQSQFAQTLQNLIGQYGPNAATALQTAWANRTQSLDALRVKVAKKRAQFAEASNPVKRAKLGAEIAGLEAQIRRLEAAQASAQAQVTAPPPAPRQALPAWLPWALAGGLVIVGAVALTRNRK